MTFRSAVGKVLTVVLVLIIVFVIATQLLGFPSPVSYVETDSMEPQLEPGDGFIGIPKPLAGEISPNDVVTYRAQTIGGGGLTTHRIVRETENGYTTKGDNNPFVDQDGAEPPVTESQIELVVLQMNGEIVVLPHVGDVAIGVQNVLDAAVSAIGLRSLSGDNPGIVITVVGLLFVISAGIYDIVTPDDARSMSRSARRSNTIDSRLLLVGILLILSLPLLSVTALPSQTQELTILSAEFSNPDDNSVIKAGTSAEINSTVENDQMLPMVIIIEPATEGIEFDDRVFTAASGETVSTKLRLYAPSELGTYTRARSIDFYLHLLPASLIAGLHQLHPLLARVATMSVILGPITFLYWVFVGFRTISLREVNR